MVPFQDTQKILRENTRFTRNSESKREFFTKHPQVNIFLIEAFSGLDLQVSTLLITFYLIMNRLTEGNSQNQAKELCVLRYNVLVHFPFLFFILIFFSLFSLFVCVINYLFSLGLHSFSIFEHVRLSNLIFVLSMFFFFWVQGFGRVCICMLTACTCILEVCIRIQLGCVHRPYVCALILMPRNPNQNPFYFYFFILLIQYASTLSCFVFMSPYLYVCCFVCSLYDSLGFNLFVLPWTCI